MSVIDNERSDAVGNDGDLCARKKQRKWYSVALVCHLNLRYFGNDISKVFNLKLEYLEKVWNIINARLT